MKPPHAPALRIAAAVLTDIGLVRGRNEDAVLFLSSEALGAGAALAIVADGMGGHPAGDVASRIAVDTVVKVYRAEQALPPAQRLARCLAAADAAIRRHAADDPACTGMGTTCTVLAIDRAAAFLGHIGDSRAYLLRRRLRQLSDDHSVVGELVRTGALTPVEARRRPDRHLILRALGIRSEGQPQVWPEGLAIRPGDVFLLCSDGLTDLVEDAEIAGLLRSRGPEAACRALVDAALGAGGRDNISVAVVAIGPG